MNRFEYLAAVRERLQGLRESDITRSLDYYVEMIDDRMEEGLSEEEAVAALPSPEEAAEQILMDQPLPKLARARLKPKRQLAGWEILLLVLGSPLWLPLVLTGLILLLTAYLLIWVAVLVLWTLELSFAAVAVAGLVGFVQRLVTGGLADALYLLGFGLAGAGLVILFSNVCTGGTRGSLKLGQKLLRRMKARIIKKEEKL